MSKKATLGYLLKAYPRLSETFILNEILLLEKLGFTLRIFAMRRPDEAQAHPQLQKVKAKVSYMPDEVWRFALWRSNALLALSQSRYWRTLWAAMCHSIRQKDSAPLKRFLQAAFWVQQHHRKAPVNHLHAHFCHDPTTVVFFIHQLCGMPFSVSAHAKDIFVEDSDFLKQKLEKAAFVATCTNTHERFLKQLCGERLHVETVYHGVNLERFGQHKETNVQSVPLILSVGRLVPKKGFRTLLHALHQLAGCGLKFQCLIVGDGPQRQALMALVEQLSLSDQVRVQPAVSQDELINHYQQASMVALACQVEANGDRDGIPNVLTEAMCMGIPVVTTDASSIAELIRDGVSGMLVPEKDPAALAAAMQTLIESPALAAHLGQEGQKMIRRQFDASQTILRLKALFDEVMAE